MHPLPDSHDSADSARRERIMRSLLEDLQLSKNRLEAQKSSLEEANRQLAALSAIKDEFVANASHELRTPLTVIREGISLLQDGSLGPVTGDQKNFLGEISVNVDRLSELINNMLDLSKLEQGRLRLQHRRIEIRPLLDAVVKQYRLISGARSVRIDAPEQLPPILVDPDRMMQVVGNLLSNAFKFTRDDGTILISAQQADGAIRVSIQDDGIGIAEQDIAKLFQRFSQVGSAKEGRKGTGLGLALSKQLVELHGGQMTVDSKPGRGSTFAFTVPLYSEDRMMELVFQEAIAALSDPTRIGMLVLDAVSWIDFGGRSDASPSQILESLTGFLRKHTSRNDHLLSIEPRWVMILADADRQGLGVMRQRLETALRTQRPPVQQSIRWGMVCYPEDGPDAKTLFDKAVASLTHKETSPS